MLIIQIVESVYVAPSEKDGCLGGNKIVVDPYSFPGTEKTCQKSKSNAYEFFKDDHGIARI
jgi:hypothetical protein